MDAQKFRHAHRVTYADCTIGDHIYYSRYFELLEAARGEFFRHLGVTFREWLERDAIFPVVECNIRYHAPAHYDDLLAIDLWLTTAERIRLDFAFRIANQNERLIVEGATSHVCTTMDGKPQRLPVELVNSVQPYLNRLA